MSATDLQLPPNTRKITTVTPSKGLIITPSTQRTTKPLAPEVSAQFNKGESYIIVQSTVLIDAAASIATLDIFQGPAVTSSDGAITIPVYVAYTYKEEIPVSLYPYSISFQIKSEGSSDILTSQVTEVEAFLWDEDPIGSRGTRTTVKPPQ
ncbi:MAG: hypothetical protein ACI828_001258 [Flavobacteriales bacterium]|jgi:hypothetical protein